MKRVIYSSIKHITSFCQIAFSLFDVEQAQPFYKIVKMPDKLDKNIHFQLIGKAVVLKALPEKIMRDDLLLGFSRGDVALITHLGTKNELELQPKEGVKGFFRIMKQVFSLGKTRFLIEKDTGEVSEYEASELYNDPSIAEKFNGLDGMKIGYSVAEEHHEKIIRFKKEIKIA